MKALLPYIKPYRRECVVSPLFKLFEAVLELCVPLVMAAIIDRGIRAGDGGYVLRMGLVLAGLGILGFACSATAQYFAARAATGFAARLRAALFARVQRFSYAELDAIGTPTLLNRLTTDVDQVQTGVNMTLRLLLRSPFVVVGAMVMAFAVNARAALVFAALIPLLSLVVWAIMRVALPRHRAAQRRLDAVMDRVRENLTGVRVLRAFNKQQSEVDGFDADTGALCDAQRHAGRATALMNPLTYALVNLALVALLSVVARQVDAGALPTGSAVALVSYLSQILVELIKFANLILTITRAIACAGRVEGVLTSPASEGEDGGALVTTGSPEAVRFDHVSFRYPGAGGDALCDISFTALRGQRVGVVGGTGSGKTTLVNLIPRFYDATGGAVYIDGVDAREQPRKALRARVAVVPQKATLFCGTIRQNLLWGDEGATDDELWRALEVAQAAEIVRGKPGGLDEMVEQNARNLSGGQRQRLTIARALVRKPDILILDDSASALDYATEAALRGALAALDPPPTTFVVSQRAGGVRSADLILALDDGRLVGAGTHDELMATCGVYREIYGSQYPKEATA